MRIKIHTACRPLSPGPRSERDQYFCYIIHFVERAGYFNLNAHVFLLLSTFSVFLFSSFLYFLYFFSSQWPEVRLLRFFNHLNFSLILKIFLFYVRGDFILILILQMIAFHKHLGISEYCFLYSRNFLLYLVYGWWASLFSRDFVNLF